MQQYSQLRISRDCLYGHYPPSRYHISIESVKIQKLYSRSHNILMCMHVYYCKALTIISQLIYINYSCCSYKTLKCYTVFIAILLYSPTGTVYYFVQRVLGGFQYFSNAACLLAIVKLVRGYLATFWSYRISIYELQHLLLPKMSPQFCISSILYLLLSQRPYISIDLLPWKKFWSSPKQSDALFRCY